MNIPINIFTWVAGALPILLLLLLIIKFKWGAAKAAPVSLLAAFIIGNIIYKAPIRLLSLEISKGIWDSLSVLLVVFPAILIYEVTDQANGFKVFRRGMQNFSPNELLQIIAIGWVFVSFLMGITGFGVPVAVGAPLLLGLGVNPIGAVIIPLLGHAWGNTFGTLAVAWDSLILSTGLTNPAVINNTAFWAAIFLFMFNFVTGIIICWFYGKLKAIKKGMFAVVIISLIQGGGQLFLSQVNQTISAFIPSCIALGVIFLLGRTKYYNKEWKIEDSPIMDRDKTGNKTEERIDMTVNQAFFPYYVLTLISVVVLVIMPIKRFFGAWKIGFSFPETVTNYNFSNAAQEVYSPIAPLIHPGIFLLIASIVGYIYFAKLNQIKYSDTNKVLVNTLEKAVPSSIAVISLIVMSKLMAGSGQIQVLAEGTAEFTGIFYSVLAPLVGVLGSFITSSNMASNILFGEFQLTTSNILDLNSSVILGAQTAGGAIGNIISPGNVILGTTTAGILGQEGIILKKLIPISISVAIFCGIFAFFILNFI